MNKLNTDKFGSIDYLSEEILELSNGILGFEHLQKWILFDPEDHTFIHWLISIEDSSISLPVLKKETLSNVLPNKNIKHDLFILTIPKNIEDMTVNLFAPIILKEKKQVFIQNEEIRFPCFLNLKKNIVSSNQGSLKQ